MKFALIVLIIISSCFFVGVLSAQNWSGTEHINRNLNVCSSGIRGNACDRTLQHGPGGANRQSQVEPGDTRVRTDYPSYVESMIATNFVLPRGSYKDLSAIVTFKISRDGNVTGKNLERIRQSQF